MNAPAVPVQAALADLYERYAADERLAAARSRATQMVPGEGNTAPLVVFVGEAPGADEDRLGRPFVGRSGRLLDELLYQVGIDRLHDAYTTNLVKYRPPDNADPGLVERYASLPYLEQEIELLDPALVVTLGRIPGRDLYPGLPRITDCHGQPVAFGERRVLLPMVHPAYAARGRKDVLAHDVAVLAYLLRSPDDD